MPTFFDRVKVESQILIPTIIYFLIAFMLIHFTQGLLLRSGVERYYSYIDVLIGAVAVACLVVIINTISFMNIFHNKPLVYNIAWKFFIYSFLILLFRIVEFFFYYLFKTHNLVTAYFKLKSTLLSPIFWSIEMWLILTFFIYVTFNEFMRAVGREKIHSLFFG